MPRDEADLNSFNPYLQGLFAPVSEEVTALDLKVEGEIPKDFCGAYYRNGPNPRTAPAGMHHWFDGDGMVHAVYFENGKAEYRNRYIRSRDFNADEAGVLKRAGIFSDAADDGNATVYKDTANTDIVCHAGEMMALWYVSGRPVRMHPRTLETLREETFGGRLPNNISAHSKVDVRTGELLFFDYALYEPWYSYGVVSKDNELVHFTKIDLPGPRLPHDMAMTENHVVLMDLPVVFTEAGLRNKVWHIHSDPKLPTRFGVLPRRGTGSDIRWFEFAPCYIYHVVNAWEQGDEIVMYCCKYVENGRPLNPQFGPYAPMVGVLALRAVLTKWRMNLKSGATREEQVDDAISEFPVVNLGYAGREGRYSYHVAIPDLETQKFDGLYKYDLKTGAREMHVFPHNSFGTEPAFAPRLDAGSEDDGYLITFVTDGDTGASEALIIDAQNFSAPPLARVKIPQRVPLGFHGTWASASEMKSA
ncbi:MAG: carotenoid oxygenase family protein [Parvularculaceae bacterium]